MLFDDDDFGACENCSTEHHRDDLIAQIDVDLCGKCYAAALETKAKCRHEWESYDDDQRYCPKCGFVELVD